MLWIRREKKSKRQKSRSKFLMHLLSCLWSKDLKKVSIRKIADLIEYSPTTVYLYFKDKNEILFPAYTSWDFSGWPRIMKDYGIWKIQ